MPFVKPPLRRAVLAVTTMLVTAAVPAAANAAGCPTAPTTKPFSAFGDLADYTLAPAGAFEGGATGWSLSGASVVAGNETYKVHGGADAKSLAIQATGAAVTPAFCVSIAEPSFRFFARRTSGGWGVLNVIVRWTDAGGHSPDTTAGALTGDGYLSWQPSPMLALGRMLPLWQPGSTVPVRLVFDPQNHRGCRGGEKPHTHPYNPLPHN